MNRWKIGCVGLALAVVAPAMAAEAPGARDLYGVRWEPSLERAKEVASASKGAAKPILWFRVLGALDGLT
jgi:hypothetical protein